MSEDDWAEVEAREVRIWIDEPVVGIWCPTCLLSTGWRAAMQTDPADPPTMWMYGCIEDKGHTQAVANYADPENPA